MTGKNETNLVILTTNRFRITKIFIDDEAIQQI